MQSSEKIKVSDLNDLLTCMLCKGYYIDATTIIECLHSFCRTCIVRYLKENKYCPKCEVQIHKAKPLENIRSDQTLQDIVYKLVPNLFKNEMKRRRLFYSQKTIAYENIPTSSEKRGDVWGCDRLIFTPDDIISVSLECYPLLEPLPTKLPTNIFPVESLCVNNSQKKNAQRRYFRCPGALKVYHLKKLLRAKYSLPRDKQIDIIYMLDILKDEFTLVDLAYIYAWKRSEPLRLFYEVTEKSHRKCTVNCFSPEKLNNKEIFLPMENNCVSPCSAITCESSSTMATTPSSRQSSRPPSPQMAEEPKDIGLERPNCAAMLSPQNPIISPKSLTKSKSKSVFKKPINVSNSNSSILPKYQSIETFKQKCKDKNVSLADFNSRSNLNPVNNFPIKKEAVDLVQNCYNLHFKPKCNSRSLERLKSVNDSAMCNIIHMRRKYRFVSNKSS